MSCLPSLDNIAFRYSSRWEQLAEEIKRVELVIQLSPEEVCDKCKNLCESVMKEILANIHGFTDEQLDGMGLTDLMPQITDVLNFDDIEKKLVNSEVTYLYEVRNSFGTAGHGRRLGLQADIRSGVDADKNTRILSVTDSLLTTLVTIFEGQFPEAESVTFTRKPYIDAYLDDNFGSISIGEEDYYASEILYGLNPEEYSEYEEVISEENNE